MKNKSKILVLSAIALFGMTAAVAPTFNEKTNIVTRAAEGDALYTLTCSKNTSNSSYDKNYDVTQNSIDWTANANMSVGDYWRIGGKNLTDVTRTIKGCNSLSKPVKQVVISHNGVSNTACKVNYIQVVAATDSAYSNIVQTVKIDNPSFSKGTAGTLEFNMDSSLCVKNCFYKIEFNFTYTGGNYGLDVKSIKFVEGGEAISAALDSITLSNKIDSYYQGDSFILPTVIAHYAGVSNTKDVTSKVEYGNVDTQTIGQHTVQISYTENNVTKTVDYTYTVQADELQSLTLGGEVKGSKGKDWDLSGVTLTGSFASGNKTITGFTPTTETTKPIQDGTYTVKVKVSYGGKNVEKDYTVKVETTGLTEDDPFNVKQACDFAEKQGSDPTTKDYYVIGVIDSATYSSQYSNSEINLKDEEGNLFKLYRAVKGGNITSDEFKSLKKGDKVLAKGKIKKYISTYEMDAGCAVIKILRNTHNVSTTLTGCALDISATFDFNNVFNATLVANTGYALPETISMTVGGVAFTDFTYNKDTGAISTAADSVNNDLNITAIGTKINYTVSTSLTGVTLEELPETAQYGETLEATFALVEGCVNPEVKVLNNNVDVTASAYDEGNSKITLTVQGNVEITITATPNDLASIAFVEGTDMTKKSYIASEEWDFSGLEVEGVMSSGEKIPLDDVTFTADKTVAEAPTSIQVTATYNDKTAVLTISGITVTPVSLASITATPSQDETTFTMGEEFKADNLVVAGVNNDGSTVSTVEGYSVDSSAFNTYAPGTYTITVTKGALTTSYEVEVVTKTLPTTDLFMKATSTSDLKVGDEIILVANDADYAMSGKQNTNNRSGVSVIINNGIANVTDDIQVITLEEGTKAGTFALKTDEGYLSATSSSNNYLGSRETKTDDSSWEITITSGVASLVAQGSNSRKVMQYNPNNDSPLFSCYSGSSQKAICIYKNTPVETGKGDLINLASATLKGEPDLKIGDKLSVNDIEVKGLLNTNEQEVIESGFTFDNANGDGTVTLTQATNTITVKYNSFSIDMVVTAREPAITDETIVDVATQDDKTTLFGGETTQLFALLSSGEGEPDNKEVTWSSSNEDVATVDQNGLVTTKVVSADNTKVTITATPKDGGTAGSIEITVNKDDVNGIQLVTGPEQIAYKYGETFSAEGLKIKETYESGKTSDPIAYDSSTFTLSIADGATLDHSASTVNVTYGGHTLNNAFTLTVGKIATSLSIENYTSSIFEKQEYKLGDNATATVTYSDGSTDTVTIPEENVSLDTSTFGSVQGEAFIVVDGVKVSTTLVVNVMKDYAAGIQFISGPDTLEYDHNATFNPEGIKLVILHDSNTPEEIDGTDSRLSYSPSTLSTVGKQTITVTFTDAYGNKVSTNLPQQVTVNKTISKVETTSYEVYRDYNAQGTNTPVVGDIYQSDNITIKATIRTTYSDGTTKDVTKLISFGTLVEGENTATTVVDGVTLSFTLENVIGVALSSINLDTANVTKTGYIEGQTADLSGLVVKAHYNNGADVILNSDQYTVTGTTLSAGQNAIIISFGDKSATFYVTADSKQVSNIELVGAQTETYLTADEIANLAGNGYQLKINYNNNTNETIDITQSMVSVDGNTVTITYSGKTATYTIVPLTASNASSITIENSTATVTKGDTYTFNPGTVTAHYTGTNKTVILPAGSYTVDNVVTTEVGTATYYVTINGTDIKASFTINVAYADATGVAINGNTTTIYAPGETATFTATVNPDTADQRVTWTSSDNSVATVENGVVTFKKDGNVTITATSVVDPTKTCQITLTCETPVVNVTGVSLDKTTLTLDVEENPTATLVATVTPNDATNANVTWSTSDGSIVYVDQSGNLSALAEGTATITVTTEDGNKTATCVVTVTAPHVDPVEPQKVGCKGSVVAASAIVSGLAIAGASLLVSKKRKEDK